VPRRETSQQL
jgi:hypothetical protein